MGTITKLNDVLCSSILRVDAVGKTAIRFWDDNTFCPAVSPTPTPTKTTTPTPTPTLTPTPTPSPAGLTKYDVESCCDGTRGITESTGLSVGDVFIDNKGNCWFVVGTTTGAVTVTFDTYIGTDCQECINTYGCYWLADCCVNTGTIIVNDLGFPPFTPGDSIKNSNNVCYTIVSLTLGPATDTVTNWYRSCEECSGDGGNDCR